MNAKKNTNSFEDFDYMSIEDILVIETKGNVVKFFDRNETSKMKDKLIWNANDSTGKKVAPGIYLIQINGDKIQENLKVVIQ